MKNLRTALRQKYPSQAAALRALGLDEGTPPMPRTMSRDDAKRALQSIARRKPMNRRERSVQQCAADALRIGNDRKARAAYDALEGQMEEMKDLDHETRAAILRMLGIEQPEEGADQEFTDADADKVLRDAAESPDGESPKDRVMKYLKDKAGLSDDDLATCSRLYDEAENGHVASDLPPDLPGGMRPTPGGTMTPQRKAASDRVRASDKRVAQDERANARFPIPANVSRVLDPKAAMAVGVESSAHANDARSVASSSAADADFARLYPSAAKVRVL
jgi:hypothetical protein